MEAKDIIKRIADHINGNKTRPKTIFMNQKTFDKMESQNAAKIMPDRTRFISGIPVQINNTVEDDQVILMNAQVDYFYNMTKEI